MRGGGDYYSALFAHLGNFERTGNDPGENNLTPTEAFDYGLEIKLPHGGQFVEFCKKNLKIEEASYSVKGSHQPMSRLGKLALAFATSFLLQEFTFLIFCSRFFFTLT